MHLATDPDTLIDAAEEDLSDRWRLIDKVALANQGKVLEAFHEERLTEEFFQEKTGYGRNDAAREAVDSVFARVFGAEAAAVRMQMVSGTHALACALFGNLLPGQRLVSLTGRPYDTLEEVIGLAGDEPGALRQLGVDYSEVDVIPVLGDPERLAAVVGAAVAPPAAVAYVQKSCGYSFSRPALSNEDIRRLAAAVKSVNPRCTLLVDNCYGEFVEEAEPPAVGADLVAGSLIKNPGGGLALSGGYLAGKQELVARALNRLTAPGIGGHMGLTYNQNRLVLQGLFLAPSVVAQAVKGAMLFAHVFQRLGFEVMPGPHDERRDIIQAIKLGSAERLVAFCRAIQRYSPVNAHVLPEPAEMPGYQHAVVMAGGSFIEGSTIELSADGPLRPPYAVYLQGGLSYLHVKYVLSRLLERAGSGDLPFFDG